MSLISVPNVFTVGAVIVASQHNSNFSVIFSDYNGNIDNTNLSASAAIADTKLAQITTASKISGAALTLLPNIPAGAGVVPIANLASGTPTGSKFIRDDGTLQAITGLLGSWSTKSITTVYQAATDLFVSVTATATAGSISIITDSAAIPSTTRVTGGGNGSGAASIGASCLVKKNDYYEVTKAGDTSAISIFIIPIGS